MSGLDGVCSHCAPGFRNPSSYSAGETHVGRSGAIISTLEIGVEAIISKSGITLFCFDLTWWVLWYSIFLTFFSSLSMFRSQGLFSVWIFPLPTLTPLYYFAFSDLHFLHVAFMLSLYPLYCKIDKTFSQKISSHK